MQPQASVFVSRVVEFMLNLAGLQGLHHVECNRDICGHGAYAQCVKLESRSPQGVHEYELASALIRLTSVRLFLLFPNLLHQASKANTVEWLIAGMVLTVCACTIAVVHGDIIAKCMVHLHIEAGDRTPAVSIPLISRFLTVLFRSLMRV